MKSSLNGKILRAFTAACREKRFEVAEHLLKALEAVEGDAFSDKALRTAYLEINKLVPQRRSGKPN